MEYNLNHEYRGLAVVFANEFRGQGTLERLGCERDIKMMQELFERLDFLVIVYKDLSSKEMVDKMNRVSRYPMNVKSDCLVVVISTHGTEVKEHTTTAIDRWHNAVYGNDCTVVYVDQILKIFQESDGLKNKPKLFFIQACRSRNIDESVEDYVRRNGYDHGKKVEVVVGASSNSNSMIAQSSDVKETFSENMTERDAKGGVPESGDSTLPLRDMEDASPLREAKDAHGGESRLQLPSEPLDLSLTSCPEDFLIMYPVMPEKYAFSDDKGSYMMQYMAENMSVLLKGGNILQYTTKVCKSMAEFELKEVSVDDMRLTFFESIKELCKEENRHMLKNIQVDIKKNTEDSEVEIALKDSEVEMALKDSEVEIALKDYFQDSFPPKAEMEIKRIKDLIIHVKGDGYKNVTLEYLLKNYKDDTREYLLNNFQQWVIYLSDSKNSWRESVQKYLSDECNITLRNKWDENDLANCFKIICKLSKMKEIVHQLLPFKTTCCVYHRLRGTVTFLPK